MRTQNRDRFAKVFWHNVHARSRTAKGKSDILVSTTKKPLLLSGDMLARQVKENTESIICSVWRAAQLPASNDPAMMRSLGHVWYDTMQQNIQDPCCYIDAWAELVASDKVRRSYRINVRYRPWEVSYGSLSVHPLDLEDRIDMFYAILSSVIDEVRAGTRTRAELLAYADHMMDGELHPWADGCGRISTALVMWLALIVPRSLPIFGTREEHYASITNLPKHIKYFEQCLVRRLPKTPSE